MKVEILDNETFAGLNPTDIEHYLTNTGWQKFRRTSSDISIWDKKDQGGSKYRVWAPLDRSFGDFSESIGRLIKTVATAENRSQLQLLEDLETVTIGDIVRVKSRDRFNKASSSLPLEEGISLINQAQRMTSAAACAAIEKKEVHPFRRPNKVIDYMKKLRIGQTERGSYLIKLISPVALDSMQQTLPEINTRRDIPFERQVVVSLMEGLDALHRVSVETDSKGQFYFEAFQEVVAEGVSANLCEAITMISDAELYHPIEVSVTWSYAIAPPYTEYKTLSFEPDLMPYIAEAARQFRERNPEEATLRGYIT